jgi:hypothetical protein
VIDTNNVPPPLVKWDADLTKRVMDRIGPVVKWYHRCEVRGLETFPAGGALVVSNHSGGQLTTDLAVFATGFYENFGYSRAVYMCRFGVSPYSATASQPLSLLTGQPFTRSITACGATYAS